MATKTAAADELRKFGKSFRNILELCDELDRIGSLENAAQEAVANHSKAMADVREAEQQLLNKQAQYAEVEGKVRYAKVEADKIVADATVRAQEIKDAALIESNNLVAAAKQEVAHHKQAVGALRVDVNNLTKTKQEIEAEIERLNGVIENARAVARKIIEG